MVSATLVSRGLRVFFLSSYLTYSFNISVFFMIILYSISSAYVFFPQLFVFSLHSYFFLFSFLHTSLLSSPILIPVPPFSFKIYFLFSSVPFSTSYPLLSLPQLHSLFLQYLIPPAALHSIGSP